MRIYHPVFSDSIYFEENKINILCIENQTLFSSMINELINQCQGEEGEFMMSIDYSPVEISKILEIILTPFNIDFNSKKIINNIYQSLVNIANNENYYLQTQEVKAKLELYVETITQSYEFPLSFNNEPDVMGMFKLFDIKYCNESNSIIEKIIDYMMISRNLFKTNCFVFVNLKSYIQNSDIMEFYKFVNYNKFNILLLESTAREKISEFEIIRIIDNDFCEIY